VKRETRRGSFSRFFPEGKFISPKKTQHKGHKEKKKSLELHFKGCGTGGRTFKKQTPYAVGCSQWGVRQRKIKGRARIRSNQSVRKRGVDPLGAEIRSGGRERSVRPRRIQKRRSMGVSGKF